MAEILTPAQVEQYVRWPHDGYSSVQELGMSHEVLRAQLAIANGHLKAIQEIIAQAKGETT